MVTAKKVSGAALRRRPPASKSAARKTARAKPPAPASVTVAAAKAVKDSEPVKPVKPVKEDKAKKPKLVRDSFTIPKGEYGVLQDLKERAGRAGIAVKKSELLRAGIKALAAMGDAAFAGALAAVPALKTGRPGKSQ